MFVIEEELKKLPQKPGVYLMHDAQDNIIYVRRLCRSAAFVSAKQLPRCGCDVIIAITM